MGLDPDPIFWSRCPGCGQMVREDKGHACPGPPKPVKKKDK